MKNKTKIVSILLMVIVATNVFVISLFHIREHPPYPDYLSFLQYPDEEVRVEKIERGMFKFSWQKDVDNILIRAVNHPYSDNPSYHTAKPLTNFENRFCIIFEPNTKIKNYFSVILKNNSKTTNKLIVSERIIDFDNVINFRDIGGYKNAEGKYVKWGKLYRSGDLASLNEKDKIKIDNLGIMLVYDLRTSAEVKSYPDNLPSKIKLIHLPIYSNNEEPGGFWSAISRQNLSTYWERFNIIEMAEAKAENFGHFLKMLANQENVPTIIHCTAGKDRAGIASAFLLLLLGVPEDTVINDYSISNIYFPQILNQAEKRYQEHEFFTSLLNMKAIDLQIFYLAKRETLKKLIKYLNNKYGSVDNFLLTEAKIEKTTIETLRDRFLTNDDR